MAGEEEKSGIGGGVAFVGRLLALLTAQEAAERYVCEEYQKSIRYIRSMLLPGSFGGGGGGARLPPSPIALYQQQQQQEDKKKIASSSCKIKKPLGKTTTKKKQCDSKVGYKSVIPVRQPVSPDSMNLSCSSIEFAPEFESLLQWSKEQESNKAKEAALSCLITLKAGSLSRQNISQGEKRFLAQLGRLESGTPAYQIQDMQMHVGKLVQTCRSKTIGFLLRIAPEPNVAKRRDTCMAVLLKGCEREKTSFVDLKGRRLVKERPPSYDKLWLYKVPGVAKILERNLAPPNVANGGITYNDPQQVSGIVALNQRIELVLVRWYLEESIGEFIAKTRVGAARDDLEHCRLAHTLLCNEGAKRSLVIAQRVMDDPC